MVSLCFLLTIESLTFKLVNTVTNIGIGYVVVLSEVAEISNSLAHHLLRLEACMAEWTVTQAR